MSSILSNSIYGSSTNKGVGGLLSGLDTDELVTQMTAGTRSKINRQYQAKQKLLYRQEAYREISSKLIALNSKYFSYSSGSTTNILSSKFFESYTFKPSSSYVNVTGNADNIKNFEINEISSVATAASFASNKTVSSREFSSEEITAYTSALAGATMTIEYDGKSYSLAIDKRFGCGNYQSMTLEEVARQLNLQIEKIGDLNGETGEIKDNLLEYKVEEGRLIVNSKEEGKKAKLSAASTEILEKLNMKAGEEASSSEGTVIDTDSLQIPNSSVFKNSYITFEFNGVLKTIDLAEKATVQKEDGTMEEINLNDADSLEKYLQYKLDNAYGKDKVVVEKGENNRLTFSAKDGTTNIFGVSSISTALSNFTGIESGDYNRLNKTKPIVELGLEGITEENAVALSNGKEGFIININDVDIEIEATMSVNDVINKINSNAEAGVKVYYSATTDTFTVKAAETGAHKGVSIIDAGEGTLAQALFGKGVDLNEILDEGEYIKDTGGTKGIYKLVGETETKVADIIYDDVSKEYTIDYSGESTDITGINYIVNAGTDTKMTYTLNGVPTEITRSTANFTIDEINIELNEKAAGLETTDMPVTFDVTNNTDEVVERVKQFIDEYNEIITLIGTETSELPDSDYPPLTPEQQDEMSEEEIKNWTAEAKKGVLYGDTKMNSLLRSMREAMSGFTDVSSLTLSGIGISAASMDTSGKLVLDEEKFKEKLMENPDEIARLFTGTASGTDSEDTSGISVQLQQILIKNVGTYGNSGILIDEAGLAGGMTADRNYISERIEEYDDKMADLKDSLEDERERYWNKFTALEESLNQLNSQSSWLTDMLGN